jgi:DNA-directed RNA polymerase subunit M/transcription elongation factor TFIIS
MPKNCPKCDAIMDRVEAEPDVGIENSLYSCTQCDYIEEIDYDESDFMDDAARDESNHRGGS